MWPHFEIEFWSNFITVWYCSVSPFPNTFLAPIFRWFSYTIPILIKLSIHAYDIYTSIHFSYFLKTQNMFSKNFGIMIVLDYRYRWETRNVAICIAGISNHLTSNETIYETEGSKSSETREVFFMNLLVQQVCEL